MMKKIHGKKVNFWKIAAALGVMLGNIALLSSCPLGIYEPAKPAILKGKE